MSQIEPGSHPPGIPVYAPALAYSTPAHYQRPGIITAIGVIGIVVGCLSLLSSFGTGMNAYGFYMISSMIARMSRTVPATMAPSVAPTPQASAALPVGEAGVAVNTLGPMLKLDGRHQRELDRMLRLHGREALGGDDDTPLTGAAIRQAVTSSRPMAPSDAPPAEFVTALGTVDVYADHAVFASADGSTTVNTSARGQSNSVAMSNTVTASSTFGPSSTGSTLTSAQLASVVSGVNGVATSPLTPGQLQSLKAELSKPNQTLVTAGSPTPVISATVQPPGGSATIMFNTGNVLVLGPAGQVTSSGPLMPKFTVSGWAVAWVVLEALASAGLAVFLIVASIVVLRGSFIAPRLMRVYAWTKIPLAIMGAVALAVLGYQFYSGMSGMPGMTASAAGAGAYGYAMVALTLAALGMAFPIGVLIALRSRTVRGYFNTVVNA